MATILIDPVIVFAGSTVTTQCKSVTINVEADEQDITTFGNNGWKQGQGGLKSGSVDFEFLQDFGATGMDALIWPTFGGTAAVKVRPGGTAAISTANPEFQFTVNVLSYTPCDGAVGDVSTISVSFPITGAVTRAVTG